MYENGSLYDIEQVMINIVITRNRSTGYTSLASSGVRIPHFALSFTIWEVQAPRVKYNHAATASLWCTAASVNIFAEMIETSYVFGHIPINLFQTRR